MKKKRYIISLVFIILMVIIAEYTGELEIIFPEILALLSGALIADKQPWKVRREQLFILMTLSAIVGICIVRYLNIPLVLKISIAFTFAYIALTITKTTIVPLISACILPILLNTSSWIYPIAVSIMSGLIVIIQYYMEKLNIREKEEINIAVIKESSQTAEVSKNKDVIIKYIKTLLVIFIVSFFPTQTNNLYFIAPPLIVTFIEFSDTESPVRRNTKKIFFIISFASLIGTTFRIFFNVIYGCPLWIVTLLITICIFMCFEVTHIIFPPAGAIGILPILLNSEGLYLYPIEVTIGSFIFILLALVLFKYKGIKDELAYNDFNKID